ncbi:MAG: hypothetical protein U5L45_03995 [Saprospiraceae bacterium]|nr:hypothetical protein [Saprospiraceae bacterium]
MVEINLSTGYNDDILSTDFTDLRSITTTFYLRILPIYGLSRLILSTDLRI